ncbi:hypothetical protein GCM10010341_72700 [Streptomyces noursei]|nr:hypothetical protein GCM10010341_72700 [Streptomyces noursei]
MAVATALATGLLVVSVDMPGTGEAPGPLTPDGDRLLSALVSEIRRRHPGEPVAYLGLSFGGATGRSNWPYKAWSTRRWTSAGRPERPSPRNRSTCSPSPTVCLSSWATLWA